MNGIRNVGMLLAVAVVAVGGVAIGAYATNDFVSVAELCVSESGLVRVDDECRRDEQRLVIQGEQGPQGEMGPQGEQGPQGEPGGPIAPEDRIRVRTTITLSEVAEIGDQFTATAECPEGYVATGGGTSELFAEGRVAAHDFPSFSDPRNWFAFWEATAPIGQRQQFDVFAVCLRTTAAE